MNIAEGMLDDACDLVRRYHYSHRDPANIQLVVTWHEDGGLFGDLGPAFAAVFFSIPPTRWSEGVWELSRLVRADDAQVQLTGLIASACRIAKRRGADLLVSFADSTQGHHGGIYQAASWNYAGKRDRAMDGVLLDGRFVPGRTCNSMYGTRSPQKLAAKGIALTVLPHFDEGKHLYWRALSKEGAAKAQRIGLGKLSYPKPQPLTHRASV